jgi:hypothetical protein
MPEWLVLVLLFAWCAWWLWAVNWKKAWPVLAQGGWAPVVLLSVVVALVWSRISPAPCDCLGVTLPNFLWQLGAVGGLVALALFFGWLQGKLGWGPPDVSYEPPALEHDFYEHVGDHDHHDRHDHH